MNRNLIMLNANDPQLPQVDLFLKTLRDPNRGAFTGDVGLITTGVSDVMEEYITRKYDAFVFTNDLSELFKLPFWREMAAYELHKRDPILKMLLRLRSKVSQSFFERPAVYWIQTRARSTAQRASRDPALNSMLVQEFVVYRNKHFSKLNAIEYLTKSDSQYTKVMLCDGDMIFQRPVDDLFSLINDDKVYVGEEVNSITPGTFIYESNQKAKGSEIHQHLKYGPDAHELNVGFLLGRTEILLQRLIEWKTLMFNSQLEWLFTVHPVNYWHEQGFMRLQRDINPKHFSVLSPKHLVHLCNLGDQLIKESSALTFQLRTNATKPTVVHFCGGTWKAYGSVDAKYRRDVNSILEE